jgi:hypothetical protein
MLPGLASAVPGAENAGSKLWWTYLADYKGTPGTTLVDMGLFNFGARKQFQILITAGTTFQGDAKTQLPTAEEGTRLQALSQKVLAAMAKKGKIVHAGTFMHKKEWVLSVYAAKSDGLEAAFTQVMNERCPGCEKIFTMRTDPQWDVYRDFLYPNAATLRFYNYRAPIDQPPGNQP